MVATTPAAATIDPLIPNESAARDGAIRWAASSAIAHRRKQIEPTGDIRPGPDSPISSSTPTFTPKAN